MRKRSSFGGGLEARVNPCPPSKHVPPPSHRMVKKNYDGSFQKCKAHLVATGLTQKYGVDYFETFSPVVKSTTIRVGLTMDASLGWIVRQVDVNNAILHGILSEDVYMKQPPGFKNSQCPHYVCKLNKAIYGLKQAPRAWFHRLSNRLCELGCMMFLLVYVDDILITGACNSAIQLVVNQLHSEFALKDMGYIHYFLEIEVTRSSQGIHLNQSKYISEVLEREKMDGTKPISNPLSSCTQLSTKIGDPFLDQTLYKSIVGALQYVTITRLEISFSVNKACQIMHNPTDLH
ncbi:transmembrane signal receptor [Lithospermum erythrorhizon]|uniref:Transmembrane signal receptor n=1 Tax=Lithospermum erythrorhizon TaxID=34254 RepID=A0AAV3PVX0_LITER